ncbi:cytochrome c biogenesis protein CcdA [Persicobacter sp. CCB-QB2]|uniref:protein-disulfide reductase DsbD family protein n=1 Tax=Persicobacter sp. CCB-QB2 TaxID=1561025 RepID=UPI0006A97AA3|nr:cytochrome c biogenesis protein CcdA [Persicobacter sp. CCB-QB2]
MKKLMAMLMVALLAMINTAFADILDPAKWEVSVDNKEAKAGDEVTLSFTAKIDTDWYLYSSDFDPELGPMVTVINFNTNDSYKLVGDLVPVNPSKKYDDLWEGEYTYFKKTGEFQQKVKLLKDNPSISAVVEYQVCSDEGGQCITFDKEFDFNAFFKPVAKKAEKAKTEVSVIPEGQGDQSTSLWGFAVLAFLAGLAALLTPCVFPMIPMTVSFFTKGGQDTSGGLQKALIYGFSIIAIYTLAGTIVAATMGPEFANFLATHWAPNLFFFIVFMIFALSFLGLFEIVIPSALVNKSVANEEKEGLIGIFFMAFTLVLVSFSCTGPIVGTILVESAGGQILKPVVGMFAFSLAFAVPFTIFAASPKLLKSLPQSGGWLNNVKVVLGFLELALGLKFLSIADQTYHWGLLDREVYLAFWIVIFFMIGLYFLGKISMPHDSPSDGKVSVPKMIMAILTFTFVVYMIPGMWGAPLKALAGYLPPRTTQDFNLEGSGNAAVVSGNVLDKPAKYSDFLHLPHGLQGYFDMDEALEASKALGKPIFVDFTGHGCVNCREMEERVWSDPKVLDILREDYVILALYVDDKKELPEADWYTSEYDNKVKKTIGKQNADLQITKYNNNAQPFYLLLDSEGELMIQPKAYDLNVNNFVEFLNKGIAAYNK